MIKIEVSVERLIIFKFSCFKRNLLNMSANFRFIRFIETNMMIVRDVKQNN